MNNPQLSMLTTRLDVFKDQFHDIIRWGRRWSLYPYPFATACCGIEFMSVVSSHYDLARFGAEVVRFSPRQADLLIVAGTINDRQAPILRRIYEQMPDPKWVISMGACASSGGMYKSYHVVQGIDEIIPVDIFVPGCPPDPEGVYDAIIKIQQKIDASPIEHNTGADVDRKLRETDELRQKIKW
jgi:NADH-quinone oxidoreductase subunit B